MVNNALIVKVKGCVNNTFIQTTLKNNKNFNLNSGLFNKGSGKKTTYAIQKLSLNFIAFLKKTNVERVIFVFEGCFNIVKKNILKEFKKQRIFVIKIIDCTKIPYNGCRLRKKQRK